MADNFPVLDGSGATITMASKDIGSGVQAPKRVIVDASGAAIAVATDRVAANAPSSVRLSDGTSFLTNYPFNLVQVNGSTQSATNPLFARLTDGANAIGTSTNPLYATTVSRVPVIVTPSTLTRPADTTAYTGATSSAAGDSLSNSTSAPTALTFSNAVLVNGGGGRIERAYCKTSQTAMAGAIRLHLYRGSSAPAATNDNAALTQTFSFPDYLGYIDFGGFVAGSSNALSIGLLDNIGQIPFSANVAVASLYGLVEVRIAFTPVSAQTFDFGLWIDQI